MKRGRQMTAFEAGAPLRRQRGIRPSRVDRPNWKAECAETCLLRLERGKGCKALPIATWAGAIPSGYPAGDSDIISLPNQLPVQLDPSSIPSYSFHGAHM